MQTCPICGAFTNKPSFLQCDRVPALLNLPCSSFAAAAEIPYGAFQFYRCGQCGFLWNAAFDPALVHYDASYENNQTLSAFFDTHVNETVKDLAEKNDLTGKCVFEVGCGQGDFLRRLVEWPGSCIGGIGFDPAYRGENRISCRIAERPQPGSAHFIAGSFDSETVAFKADAVISRHVLEHVLNPEKFLSELRTALKENGKLFLETRCADWILDNHILWDFFYEQCSLFSAGALVRLVEESGFRVDSVQHRFGGQYLWLVARRTHDRNRDEYSIGSDVCAYQENVKKYLNIFHEKGEMLALWGAGAKGVAFANFFDPKRELFFALVDINPEKQGKFIPCSGHPIIAPKELRRHAVRAVIMLNSNYREEISSQMEKLGIHCDLVDLSSVCCEEEF